MKINLKNFIVRFYNKYLKIYKKKDIELSQAKNRDQPN